MQRFKIAEHGFPYFVTISIVKWLPVFVSSATCEIIIESLRFCRENKGLRVHAYIIMPTHLHLIVSADGDLAAILRDFKKYTAKRIIEHYSSCKNPPFINVFRFCGRDNTPPTEHKVWQDGNHPELIKSESFFLQKLGYIHGNPMRKELVIDPMSWTWSSLRAYEGRGESPLDVDGIEW